LLFLTEAAYSNFKLFYTESRMDIVVTLEVVLVELLVLGALHLDHSVVQLVLVTTDVGHLTKSLQRCMTLDVDGHGEFAH